eukprot:g9737.t1
MGSPDSEEEVERRGGGPAPAPRKPLRFADLVAPRRQDIAVAPPPACFLDEHPGKAKLLRGVAYGSNLAGDVRGARSRSARETRRGRRYLPAGPDFYQSGLGCQQKEGLFFSVPRRGGVLEEDADHTTRVDVDDYHWEVFCDLLKEREKLRARDLAIGDTVKNKARRDQRRSVEKWRGKLQEMEGCLRLAKKRSSNAVKVNTQFTEMRTPSKSIHSELARAGRGLW